MNYKIEKIEGNAHGFTIYPIVIPGIAKPDPTNFEAAASEHDAIAKFLANPKYLSGEDLFALDGTRRLVKKT